MLSDADLIILGRSALAAVLGFAIGWERQVTGAAIRARAIGLAAMTAAALTALGHELFGAGTDRIVQGIVTGIGFLGAGVILRGASGEVRGLTTAAAMWAMTAIGVAVGSGYELLGVGLAALVYLIVAWGEWPVLSALRRAPERAAADGAGRRSGEASSEGRRPRPAAAISGPAGTGEHDDSAGENRSAAAPEGAHQVPDSHSARNRPLTHNQ